MMDLWTRNRQVWTDKINKDLLTKTENHQKEIKELKEHYESELKKELQDLYDEAIKHNRNGKGQSG